MTIITLPRLVRGQDSMQMSLFSAVTRPFAARAPTSGRNRLDVIIDCRPRLIPPPTSAAESSLATGTVIPTENGPPLTTPGFMPSADGARDYWFEPPSPDTSLSRKLNG
ncbi:hypothetical protein PENSPDRAFT_693598 [Peniophora sp. CONT]|nr:hypothetical protein PENSPDRAFT_693598 [Peniophora sp. CONT]